MEAERRIRTYKLVSQLQFSGEYHSKQSRNVRISTNQSKRFVRDSLPYYTNLISFWPSGEKIRRKDYVHLHAKLFWHFPSYFKQSKKNILIKVESMQNLGKLFKWICKEKNELIVYHSMRGMTWV